jgi:hypothetical protein
MDRVSEFKRCKCGYSIIVYTIENHHHKPPHYHFFDGHSGDYRQCFVCPGCKERLHYMTLEG